MPRIWLERTGEGSRCRTEQLELTGGTHYWRAPSLARDATLCVRVCNFTFRFGSGEQVREYHAYYSRKLHPSSRLPGPFIGHGDHDHWESERWFERLPLFLREEPKRLKVVAALEEALLFLKAGKRQPRTMRKRVSPVTQKRTTAAPVRRSSVLSRTRRRRTRG